MKTRNNVHCSSSSSSSSSWSSWMEKWSLESERRREEIAERPAAKFSWKKKRSQLLFSLSPLLTFPCFIFYFHSDNFYFHSPHCSLFLVYLFFSLSLLLLPFHFSLSLFSGRHSIGSYSGCFYLLLASILHSFHGKMSFYLTILRDIHSLGKFPTGFLFYFRGDRPPSPSYIVRISYSCCNQVHISCFGGGGVLWQSPHPLHGPFHNGGLHNLVRK